MNFYYAIFKQEKDNVLVSIPIDESIKRKYVKTKRFNVIFTLDIDNCIPNRYTIYTMKFEFDPSKSDTNKEKHGIDFIAAQALWEDINALEIPARTSDEERFLVVGKIESKHWSAIITYRDENTRIISVRRARQEEIELYEN